MENLLRPIAAGFSITPVVPHWNQLHVFDVIIAKRFVCVGEIQAGKAMLVKIVSMLFGLIRSNSDVRVFEEPANYQVGKEEKGKSRSKNRIRNTNQRSF